MNGQAPDPNTLAKEARAIADGTSRLLATRWHLWALLELIDAQNAAIAELQGVIHETAVREAQVHSEYDSLKRMVDEL